MKIEALEALPRTMVGDGKSPNVYFVSTARRGVVLISVDFDAAYAFWQNLRRTAFNSQPILEDRQFGVLASVEPEEENSKRLVATDNTNMRSR